MVKAPSVPPPQEQPFGGPQQQQQQQQQQFAGPPGALGPGPQGPMPGPVPVPVGGVPPGPYLDGGQMGMPGAPPPMALPAAGGPIGLAPGGGMMAPGPMPVVHIQGGAPVPVVHLQGPPPGPVGGLDPSAGLAPQQVVAMAPQPQVVAVGAPQPQPPPQAAADPGMAALLRQVASMTDDQINQLQPEHRAQVLYVKDQIRRGIVAVPGL
jgi:hypothetical protein